MGCQTSAQSLTQTIEDTLNASADSWAR